MNLLSPPGRAADEPVDKVAKVATEWVRTRAETVRLETDWAGQQELLAAMVKAIEERARATEEKAEEMKVRTARDRAELETLAGSNKTAAARLGDSETRLVALAKSLVALRPFLPPRLSGALELPFRTLENPDLAVGDRMQHTMTVLNRCIQFNRTITAGDEVLTLEGEDGAKSLEVIYWGLSHAYALDRGAGKAWLGSPGAQGWRWEARPEAVVAVTRLMAVAADKADPEFVVVPARIGQAAR